MRELALIILSLAILAAYFMTGYLLIDGGNTPNAMLVYGSVSALAGGVVTYWFGSSTGSAQKDKTIANMTVQPPQEPKP